MGDVVESVVNDVILKKAKELDDKHKEKLLEVGVKIFEEGLLPKDAMDLSEDTIEAMYAHGYRLYQGAKYGDAGHVFRTLAVLDPGDPRYYLAMAACLHRMKQFETAAFMYELTSMLDKKDPMPLYYASDCRINLGHKEMAMGHLEEVIARSKNLPEYALIADRAKMTLSKLEKEEKKKGE
jgi:type III secretion system low calcium response chaperone LcrH/SycD